MSKLTEIVVQGVASGNRSLSRTSCWVDGLYFVCRRWEKWIECWSKIASLKFRSKSLLRRALPNVQSHNGSPLLRSRRSVQKKLWLGKHCTALSWAVKADMIPQSHEYSDAKYAQTHSLKPPSLQNLPALPLQVTVQLQELLFKGFEILTRAGLP